MRAMDGPMRALAEKTAADYTTWLRAAIVEHVNSLPMTQLQDSARVGADITRTVALAALGRTVTELVSTGMTREQIAELVLVGR